MQEGTTYVGLDTSKNWIDIAALFPGRQREVAWREANEPKAVKRLIKRLKEEAPAEIVICFEAGPGPRTDSPVGAVRRSRRDENLKERESRQTSKVRPAGFKFHTVISLRDDLPLHTEIGAQRVHDNRAFPESTMEAGT